MHTLSDPRVGNQTDETAQTHFSDSESEPSAALAVCRRIFNAAVYATRKTPGCTTSVLHHARWTVTALTTDAYLVGNATFFGTMAVYVIFDLIDSKW